jgi:hypothetical protein
MVAILRFGAAASLRRSPAIAPAGAPAEEGRDAQRTVGATNIMNQDKGWRARATLSPGAASNSS